MNGSSFEQALASSGLSFSETPAVDGKIHRFKSGSDSEPNSWYVLREFNGLQFGAFGCWKRQINEKWSSRDHQSLSPEERKACQSAWKEAKLLREAEEKELQARAVKIASMVFSTGQPATAHSYLDLKGVKPFGNLRVAELEHVKGWLAIPLCDAAGTITSAQFIAPDGTKRFLYGGKVSGSFFSMNGKADGPIVICEGYATGASIFESTGWATYCAMNCGNLLEVAKSIRHKDSERSIIIAADNDQFTEGNPGITKAQLAAKAIKANVAIPEFSDEVLVDKPTDFNDLHRLEGVGSVLRQIQRADPWFAMVEDAHELQTRNVPDLIQIVEGIVGEHSKLSIVSSAKSFKTWTTMYLAIAVSHGIHFLGRPTNRRKVLYVNLELKPETFTRRLQAIARALGITINPSWLFHLSLRGRVSGLTVHDIVTRIIQTAHAFGAKVIVVDPLFKLNTEGEENSSRDQTVFCNELDRLTTEGHCTAIFNDHSGKGNQADKDPLDVIRGSSAKGGDLDAAMVLRKHESQDSWRVDLVHRELAPVQPFVITWEYPLMKLNSELDAELLKKPRGGRSRSGSAPGPGAGRPSVVHQIASMNLFSFCDKCTPEGEGLNVIARRLENWLSKEKLDASTKTCQRAIAELVARGKLTKTDASLYVKGSNA